MKLQRYSFVEEDQGIGEFKDDNGEWIKWEDIEPLLKAYLDSNNKLNEIKRVLSNTICV
jgi:argonaute-like protein implicated in RNA metabolism and viral defense